MLSFFAPELVATPKLICIAGQPAEFTCASEDNADFLSVQVLIPENQGSVQTKTLLKEKNQVVLSCNNNIKLTN